MNTDTEIFKDVTQKLEFDPRFDSSNITVAVKDGIVTLFGIVSSYAAKLMAEDDVKAIRDVKGIAEELQVSYLEQRESSDSDIAHAARDALKWDVLVPDEKIQVVVENGVVTLTGEVLLDYQRESAASDIRKLQGVKNVKNNIQIKSSINASDVKSKILREFERNARIDASKVTVEVEGRKVTLRGTVRSWSEHEEAAKAAWSIPGVTNVENRITVTWI